MNRIKEILESKGISQTELANTVKSLTDNILSPFRTHFRFFVVSLQKNNQDMTFDDITGDDYISEL